MAAEKKEVEAELNPRAIFTGVPVVTFLWRRRSTMQRESLIHGLMGAFLVVGLVAVATLASAAPIYWTDWTSATTGNPGVAQGNIALPNSQAVSVSYSGQVLPSGYTVINNTYPSWGPATTFSGGTVGNPPNIMDIIGLTGGPETGVNTVTFSRPVVNPIMAIWSLGDVGVDTATFVFTLCEPFTIESGGPSNEYPGTPQYPATSITAIGNTVSGNEGSGTLQFNGTFTQISWTNPLYENYYGFTIGIPAPVPEPSTLLLLGSGLAGLGGVAWRRHRTGRDR